MTATTLTDKSVASVHKALVDFGYTGLTVQEVRETSDRLMAGGDAGSDVIAMFIQRMLRDAGVLADES